MADMTLLECAVDLVAILESPHTTVNTRWETEKQYKFALRDLKKKIFEIKGEQ